MVRKHKYVHPDMVDDAYMLTRAAQALRKRAKTNDPELAGLCSLLDDIAAKIRAERNAEVAAQDDADAVELAEDT